ncbi:phosphohistidine phosphatase SixA [Candidatus Erwinia haradaeae]|uniref:Phosphohistidine phosphatase SixA n=1 Tax=Candidatus Erwinia haradaeae TaxID=1922217 RepID=A0A451D9D5_9GAMM|nr:phosphohistidine phosphatase SixA [Candidatus Erwinia haradaeae]VFP82844.1 Phosphohistidine phosphatase SixA [Candidatus Erwinia haradaeae]
MQIFLMRHGESISKYTNDFYRPLTSRGYFESRQIAQWLYSKKLIYVEKVLISPYIRAQQTFNAIQKEFLLPLKVNILWELIPGGLHSKIITYIQELEQDMAQSVMIISHLPLIRNLLDVLCPQTKNKIFSTSAVACIDLCSKPISSKIQWYISPQIIKQNRLNKDYANYETNNDPF